MPKPQDPINISGAAQSQLMGLKSMGVETYADLARLNPYDSRFKVFGDDFIGWVNSARAIIADAVVRRVEVGESITVEAAKLYETELILKAISSRLGIFPRYVQEEVRASEDFIEVVYRRRVDDPLSLGPWLEYKMNARIYAAYLRSAKWFIPKQVEHPIPFEELLSWYMPTDVKGDVILAAELMLNSLLSDALHIAFIERGVLISSILERALHRAGAYTHFHCGSHLKAEQLAEIFSNGGTVLLEGLEKCTGEEALVVGGVLRKQTVDLNIKGESVEYRLPVKLIAFLNTTETEVLGASSMATLLARFPAVMFLSGLDGEDAYQLSKTSRFWKEEERLVTYLASAMKIKPKVIPPPNSVEEELKGIFVKGRGNILLGPGQEVFLMEAAKARCRARLSTLLSISDYEYALSLLKRVLATWNDAVGGRKRTRTRWGQRRPKPSLS